MASVNQKPSIYNMTTWDKLVFAASVSGIIVLLILTFYKNHISKEMVLENYQLKKSVVQKDSIIKTQQLTIDSLLQK